ncbi:Ribonuclease H superfamily protein [Trifolium repens]|nr:Ribonuclease H superfamily protein [Trifolium repens]
MCRFWWGSKDRQHKIHWRGKKAIFKSKLAGGLGFRDMQLFNKAMLAKQVWRLQTNPNSLLGQFLKAKYYPNSDILHATYSRSASYAWQSIYQAIDTIKNGSCWKIGNGQSIKIWEDNWVIGQNGYKILTPYNGQPNTSRVSDIIINGSTRSWNHALIDQTFFSFERTLIKQIPLIEEPIEDQLMWPHAKDGKYSVKSGYNLLSQWNNVNNVGSSHSNSQDNTWKKLWSLHTIPRHKVLIWRIIHKAITVKSELSKRGVNCNVLCPRCLIKEETIDHTFMHCPHATKIWFGSKLGICFDHRHSNISEWIQHVINCLNKDDVIYMAAVLYGIWYARNLKVFEDKDIEDDRVIINATKSINEYHNATSSEDSKAHNISHSRSTNLRHRRRSTTNKQWKKPNNGIIKINCDANLSREGRWGLGTIARNSDGNVIAAATWESPGIADPALAESAALYNAVRMAIEHNLSDVEFESDNATIISILKGEVQIPRIYVGNIVRGIICKKDRFRSCRFSHIGREANKAAHHMAFLAHDEPNRVWIDNTPPHIVSVLLRDLFHN